ncbi:MAG: peptidoglycan-binding protein, partial [Candidatus Staskawiczbacteria bacterium]
QPQVQPQPAQNNMPKMRGKSHLILKLLIVLIVLIVICVVGYFVISQNLLGTPTPVVNSPVQPVVTPVASAVAPTPTETPTPTPTPAPWCYTFTKNLGFADSGTNDIVQLHMAMQKEGFSYAPDGDNVYSDGTSKALIQFQTKYGIAPLSGFVGTKTRAQLNTLYGCPATPTPTPAPAAAVPTQPAP